MTKTAKLIDALLTMKKFVEVPSKSRKYRQFSDPKTPGKFYFVGKAGALRVGPTASKSVSIELIVPGIIMAYDHMKETSNDSSRPR